jgi:hypothetical protein
MKRSIKLSWASVLLFFVIGLGASDAGAQTYNAYSGGYNTGYGTVYGSFGLAMATQNMYQYSQMQMQKAMARAAMVKQFGLAAVEKAEREAAAGKTPAANGPKVAPPPVVRNYGVFRPDASVDTAKALADALGETPEEKQLIRTIYTATKTAYEKEAAAKGMKNNIAGALAFFTATAMFVHNDSESPSDEAVVNYFKVVNAAIDEMPEFASVSNKEKQGFHNMLIGFSGLLTAGYLEGKETENADTLAAYKKLAGMLTQMVLKTDPEKIRLQNGQIVLG